MLTYTLSKREKVLMVLLAVVLLGVLWYKLVFEGVAQQVNALDSQIANAQDALIMDSYKAANMHQMEEALEGYRSDGASVKTMPSYDNIGPLTAELNATLGAVTAYNLMFDDVNQGGSATGGSQGQAQGQTVGQAQGQTAATNSDTIQRGVTLSFDCDSYATARSILSALVGGKFPCTIDSLSIVDNSVRNGARTTTASSASFSATVHLTFYEKLTVEQQRAIAAAAAAEASSAQ